ncbi:MAG: exonuclease SbcCD subunit D [Myxococcota bacterium]
MRLIHTSDWHLGRLFHNIHLTDDQAHVLDQFVALVRDEKPDAVLIAGDIYDRAFPPASAVELLDDVLHRLAGDLRVPTFVIAGNHDSPERLGFGARLLGQRGLHVAGTLTQGLAPVTLSDHHGDVDVFLVPYASPEVVRAWCGSDDVVDHPSAMQRLLQSVRGRCTPGRRSIVVAHAFVQGGEESESERALEVGGAGAVPSELFESLHYVALGHLHGPQLVRSERLRYPGSLLKYSFSETEHEKSVALVEMDAQGAVRVRPRPLSPRRDVRVIEGTMQQVLDGAATDSCRDDYIKVRLLDAGPVLDAMAKLREVYPNVLHLERPHLGASTDARREAVDPRRLGTLELFEAFFDQVSGQRLDDRQREEVIAAIAWAERRREAAE